MTKLVFNTHGIPHFDRDAFLTPFDKMFDSMMEAQFPEVVQQVVSNHIKVQHIQKSTYMNTKIKLVSLLRFQDSIRNNLMLKLKMVY